MVQVTLRRPELRPMGARDVMRRLPLALTVFAIVIAVPPAAPAGETRISSMSAPP